MPAHLIMVNYHKLVEFTERVFTSRCYHSSLWHNGTIYQKLQSPVLNILVWSKFTMNYVFLFFNHVMAPIRNEIWWSLAKTILYLIYKVLWYLSKTWVTSFMNLVRDYVILIFRTTIWAHIAKQLPPSLISKSSVMLRALRN